MQMHFVFSDNVTLLFDIWTVQTLTGLLLSCVIVLMLTVLYELSKVWKSNLLTKVLLTLPLTPDSSLSPSLISDTDANVSSTCDPLLTREPLYSGESSEPLGSLPVRYTSSTCRWWFLHSSLALLHTCQVFLGYVLMLLVMSYNTAIFLSVIIGSAIGYYLAFPLLAKYPKPHRL
ncbi:PREDICTED: probable low affinity copper uptake protein 2 [Nanorana parkeri]|uniref:probable low affinity copper uptake protein 2 n=1 Tax=Nanorana parkeri TaxID=125878 RepID=UPI000853F69C|nr:PREDICTED: probable low affinity copper uptake protein 2 [Nanorana parkeri]